MKHKIRFIIAVTVTFVMILSLSIPGYAAVRETVPIFVGGQQLNQGGIEMENTVFLPLRAVCEGLGYSVEWSKPDRSVTVKTAEKTVLFQTKDGTITDDGHNYYVFRDYVSDAYIGTGCMLIENRIYAASDIMESCFGLTKAFDEKKNALALSLMPKGTITVENKKIFSEDQRLLTNIQYPYFSLADRAAAEKINAAILADVTAAQMEAQDNLKAYEGYESPHKFETYFNYRIVYQNDGKLSIVLNDYQYYGGAHGGDRQISHTFDLKTGNEFSLDDLMKSGSGYRDYINRFVKAEIVRTGLDAAQLTTFEAISDNQSYYLSDKGLVIYFQQYEYFPYAAGIVEFTLPYADLSGYLIN